MGRAPLSREAEGDEGRKRAGDSVVGERGGASIDHASALAPTSDLYPASFPYYSPRPSSLPPCAVASLGFVSLGVRSPIWNANVPHAFSTSGRFDSLSALAGGDGGLRRVVWL